jgi:hypothetical protein
VKNLIFLRLSSLTIYRTTNRIVWDERKFITNKCINYTLIT